MFSHGFINGAHDIGIKSIEPHMRCSLYSVYNISICENDHSLREASMVLVQMLNNFGRITLEDQRYIPIKYAVWFQKKNVSKLHFVKLRVCFSFLQVYAKKRNLLNISQTKCL